MGLASAIVFPLHFSCHPHSYTDMLKQTVFDDPHNSSHVGGFGSSQLNFLFLSHPTKDFFNTELVERAQTM